MPMKKTRQIDIDIDKAWIRLAHGVQVNIWDIPKIFTECEKAMLGGKSVDDAVKDCIVKYRQN